MHVKFNKETAKTLGKQGFIKEFSKHFTDIDLAEEYEKMYPTKVKDDKKEKKEASE